jgi:HTH-type transcriptional regulator / antitoxin HigA
MEEMGLAATVIDERRYGRLLAKAAPAVIKTEAENQRMLEKIEALMDKGERRSPEEDRLLELMAALVEDFEAKAYKVGDSSPNEVLAYMIEQRGMKQSELLPVLGCSKSFMSEMVSGRREISKANAKKLAAFFGKPVDLFI